MIADNDDLLTEILLWLPAKSLVRFKLVCKQWLSIISSRHFSHRHTLHHRHHLCHFTIKPSLLLRLAEASNYFHIQQSPYGEKWVPYHFSPTLIQPIIRGFSNGLFLLKCHNMEHPMDDCHIYNPTTKEIKRISLNSNGMYKCVAGLNIAFDPLKSPHYKIICVRTARRRSALLWRSWWCRCQIEVYESDTGAWKLCGEPFVALSDMHFNQGIYWKGSIHWCGIFFDLCGNVIREHPEVLFPIGTRAAKVYDHYVESNDYLHYVPYFPEDKSVMVFELQSDYSEWSLKYHINLDIFPGTLTVLSMIRLENEDDTLILHEPGKIMAFNFKDMSVKEIINFADEEFYQELCLQFSSQCTFQYIETLAPL